MKTINRITMLLLTLALALSTAACAAGNAPESDPITASQIITADRDGNPITLPETIESVISMGPSVTEILSALGLADMIIASDDYSAGIEGLGTDIPMLSMMAPDGERIIDLDPDIIFVTGMSRVGGDDPLKIVSDAGICVIYIPSSSSISGIKDDIRYLGQVMGAEAKAEDIIAEMESEIEAIKALSPSENQSTVYYEIQAAPDLYSFGSGVFLNEMLEIVGAKNILSDHESWVSIAEEQVLNLNPDVILTSVNYIDDPISEIMSRPGWNALTAVRENDVYYIDADSSNRPSHNIIKAIKEIAEAVYPDIYDY